MKPTAIDENQKLKFDQDLFGAWDMNPTLVSVVPLAIFKVSVRTFFQNTWKQVGWDKLPKTGWLATRGRHLRLQWDLNLVWNSATAPTPMMEIQRYHFSLKRQLWDICFLQHHIPVFALIGSDRKFIGLSLRRAHQELKSAKRGRMWRAVHTSCGELP